ncbi:MAG: ATP phosphoribosyltransferase [Gammaproteobacteria bacterium]|nr:ATP phosphoribosyltransferase [Gammaproteobacteria bacterium]
MSAGFTIALSKGRIFNDTLPLLAAAGIVPSEDPENSRKLIIGSNREDVKFLIVRASDVPTYVQYGGADMGVVGKDVLLEHGGEGLYEPLDLEIARCRLAVAGAPDYQLEQSRRPRVATKYVRCTREYFAGKAQQVEIIKLYGSMELAPVAGLADLIVDVVDSGATLKANGLAELEKIADISSRLVVNRASMKTQHKEISFLIEQLRSAVIANRS